MEYYSNLGRYNESGERVAIFGEEVGNGRMQIFILTCSKKDQFSRKFANRVFQLSKNATVIEYQGITPHPEIKFIDLDNKDKPKYSFLKWVKENYYLKQEAEGQFDGIILDAKLHKPKGFRHKKKTSVILTILIK